MVQTKHQNQDHSLGTTYHFSLILFDKPSRSRLELDKPAFYYTVDNTPHTLSFHYFEYL